MTTTLTVLAVVALFFATAFVITLRALLRHVDETASQSRFYHKAGLSSAEYDLRKEQAKADIIAAQADLAKSEALRMEEERLREREGLPPVPKGGSMRRRRAVPRAAQDVTSPDFQPTGDPNA